MVVLLLEVEEREVRLRKRRGWEVRGRLLLKLVREVFIEVWCLRIEVLGGVFLLNGSVFEAIRDLIWSFVRYRGCFLACNEGRSFGSWFVGVEIWGVFVLAFTQEYRDCCYIMFLFITRAESFRM
jgi:hypothetical protein